MIHYNYKWACVDCGYEVEEIKEDRLLIPGGWPDRMGEWCEECFIWHPEVVMRRR